MHLSAYGYRLHRALPFHIIDPYLHAPVHTMHLRAETRLAQVFHEDGTVCEKTRTCRQPGRTAHDRREIAIVFHKQLTRIPGAVRSREHIFRAHVAAQGRILDLDVTRAGQDLAGKQLRLNPAGEGNHGDGSVRAFHAGDLGIVDEDLEGHDQFFHDRSSFLNMKSSRENNKRKIFGKYINKEKQKIEEKTLKNKNFKSMSISEISNKQKLQNKNNLNLKLNNISNNIKERNPYYINNNYTIDEEKNDNIEKISSINERQNSISSNNINENYGILPHILTKRKKKKKYRVGNGKVLLTDINNKNLSRVKSAKEIAIKNDFYLNYNSSFPNFTITNSSIEKTTEFSYNKRSNSSLSIFNGNLNNIIKENNKALKRFQNELFSYIYNGKKIIPTRYTKEVLNSSYKKLNKYEQKRFQNYEIMFSKK